jgi:hypothetical protein
MRTLTLATALVLATATLSACDSEDVDTLEPRKTITRTIPEGPADKDTAEVDVTTAALAPCDLLPRLDGMPSVRRLGAPHSCRLEADNDVRVTTFEAFGPDARWSRERFDLNGVVAYRESPLLGLCSVWLPVSQTHAIEFWGRPEGDKPDPGDGALTLEEAEKYAAQVDCSTVEAYAAAAATELLDDTESLMRPEGRARLTACGILESAFGPADDDRSYERPDGGQQSCALASGTADEPAVTLEISAGPPLRRWVDEGGWDGRYVDVAGTQTRLTTWDDEDECLTHFDYGAYDGPAAGGGRLIARVISPCESWRENTRKVIEAIPAAPLAAASKAELVYAWDDQDVPGVGACVDVDPDAGLECAPAREVDVPDDPADLIAQGEVEPDVLCAASASLVEQHFGAGFAATTVDLNPGLSSPESSGRTLDCLWVRPDHATEGVSTFDVDGRRS